MDKKLNGGAAFPGIPEELDDPDIGQYKTNRNQGMTLRDYLAAKAMQSLVFNAAKEGCAGYTHQIEADTITAYRWADAMLRARDAP